MAAVYVSRIANNSVTDQNWYDNFEPYVVQLMRMSLCRVL
nr:MAG TPA_asm: hypothetical protein [Caudoviricetes sp.]